VSERQEARVSRWYLWTLAALVVLGGAAGCATQQRHGTSTIGPSLASTLKPGDLQSNGVAFITPATVTGQEEDRPALSLIFTKELADRRPGLHVVSLNETLSAISRAGASEEYKRMMEESRESGLLNRATLARVSQATGVRYIAQLKMASFHQDSQDRFSVFGLRMVMTKKADMRVFLRIWDGQDGSIVWEGAQEVYLAKETISEDSISFREVVDESARQLLVQLP
jgi:hypothetical protein